MNIKLFAVIATFALTVPTLSLGMATPSIAAAPAKLQGFFVDSKWSVDIMPRDGFLTYRGTNLATNKSLSLKRVKVSGSADRRVYTWSNSGTLYNVIWQPKDPDYVRLQVIQPGGKLVVDQLLARQEDGC
jgi:hypothetical protein